jgi:aspartyl-tRNA(Asn)/glutamyl-tRNA(Gln) amidotransferase subunit A
VSRAGVVPNSYTFDRCGPLARTVEDCALALDALAGYDPADAGSVRRPATRYRDAMGRDLNRVRIGVLRHHWEEDIPASDAVRQAMDAALDVLRRLGAHLAECRVRPLGQYYDVKIIIAETEILSVHQQALRERPGQFSADFRCRALPALLFTANDYVQAMREHRRMMLEMEPLYAQFDAFVTAGLGEAPLLADYRSAAFWEKPSALTAWNVTGQPVLSMPNGFGQNGLPLGMQLLGRPFGEDTILRIGHAFEQATDWHRRRPRLAPGAEPPTVTIASGVPDLDAVDASTRDLCARAAHRVGFRLDDAMLAEFCQGAPHALRMAERLRRDHGLVDPPANVFSLPASLTVGRRGDDAMT